MLKSLVLETPPIYFPQPMGSCYHYAPNTAALLYEVFPMYQRVSTGRGVKDAKDYANSWRSQNWDNRTLAIFHSAGGVSNSAVYEPDGDGGTWWAYGDSPPWFGISKTAAITIPRYLPCPIKAFRSGMPINTKLNSIDPRDFVLFAMEWVQQQRYYFPALRQAEIAARKIKAAAGTKFEYLTVESLPSCAAWVFMREVGNIRTPLADLFDQDGNAIASRTRVNPTSVVMRGGRNDDRVVVPRAALVFNLFYPNTEWPGFRADGNNSNDRIENLTYGVKDKTRHHEPLEYSISTKDAVFKYDQILPKDAYMTRWWRYGIERLAFDIDEHPV